jgi:hypothetical protein
MTSRMSIALLVTMMTNSVFFGIGAIVVLSVPALNEHAKYLLPAVIVLSFLLGPIVAWYIAPRMRARHGELRAVSVEKK